MKAKKKINKDIIDTCDRHIPIRMCILCRERFEKHSLKRFGIKDSCIVKNPKIGRSFYICKICIDEYDEKKIRKILSKFINLKNCDSKRLKESLIDG